MIWRLLTPRQQRRRAGLYAIHGKREQADEIRRVAD